MHTLYLHNLHVPWPPVGDWVRINIMNIVYSIHIPHITIYHITFTCTGCRAVLVLPIPSTVVTAMPSMAHNGSKQPFAEKCLSCVKVQLVSIRCTVHNWRHGYWHMQCQGYPNLHTKNLRRILQIFCPETISNQHLLTHCNHDSMGTIIIRRRRRWIGHVM